MKSPRDKAIDVVWGVMGSGFSRPFFVQLLQDTGEAGVQAKRLVDAIEHAIERDRIEIEKAHAPS